MNSEQQLKDIYRQTVLDHSRHPRNFKRLEPADRSIQGHNPLCGDKVTVYLKLDGDDIEEIAFEGTGCAISMASASIMTESLQGTSVHDAQNQADEIMQQFEIRGEDAPEIAGEMAALAGVRAYPSRVKCATLAWKALAAVLSDDSRCDETLGDETRGDETLGDKANTVTTEA